MIFSKSITIRLVLEKGFGMEAILTAILWFLLGAIVAITGLFRFVAFMVHNDEDYKNEVVDKKIMAEARDGIEKFFYGKTED